MKAKTARKVLALVLAMLMVLSMAACNNKPPVETKPNESKPSETKPAETKPGTEDPKELTTITLFPSSADTLSGKIGGFRGEVFAEHGLEVEIWAYSPEKVTAMLTTGDFPDMMYLGDGGVELLETLIETDKIINFEDYKEYLPNVFGDSIYNEYITDNMETCRELYSAGTGKLFILPFQTGMKSSYYNQTQNFDRYTPKLKWDVYEAIGAPEVTDVWSLIDICEQMLKAQPTNANGDKMFGTFLDNQYDSQYFGPHTLWYYWHAGEVKTTPYMAEVDFGKTELSYILEEDSLFKEGLKWYNEMFRRGLIDPDSVSTSRGDQAPKIDNGLAMLPSGSLPGWATQYYEVFPSDCSIQVSFVDNRVRPEYSVVIFKDSPNIEACLEYVNMQADPFESFKTCYGSEGDLWELEGNVISITDELEAYYKANGTINGFPMSDGSTYATFNLQSLVNSGTPLQGVVGINGKEVPGSMASWADIQDIVCTDENWQAWKKTMNANDLWDYAEKNNITVYTTHAWATVAYPTPSDTQSLTISALNQIIVPACWKMVYSQSEAEFDALWSQMVADAEAMGAKDIYNWFVENYVPVK